MNAPPIGPPAPGGAPSTAAGPATGKGAEGGADQLFASLLTAASLSGETGDGVGGVDGALVALLTAGDPGADGPSAEAGANEAPAGQLGELLAAATDGGTGEPVAAGQAPESGDTATEDDLLAVAGADALLEGDPQQPLVGEGAAAGQGDDGDATEQDADVEPASEQTPGEDVVGEAPVNTSDHGHGAAFRARLGVGAERAAAHSAGRGGEATAAVAGRLTDPRAAGANEVAATPTTGTDGEAGDAITGVVTSTTDSGGPAGGAPGSAAPATGTHGAGQSPDSQPTGNQTFDTALESALEVGAGADVDAATDAPDELAGTARVGATEQTAAAGRGREAAPAPAARPAPPPASAQLATAVAALRRRGDGEYTATLDLHPAELGRVQVEVEIRAGVVNVQVTAEQAGTRSLLTQQLADLRGALEQGGLNAGDLDVATGGGQQPGDQTGDTGGDGDHRAGSPAARTGADEAPEPPPPATTTTVRVPSGGLDVRL